MRQRTCLVTGAGRGIGRAVAVRLSTEGHRVALAARSADQLAEAAAALPGPALAVPADVRNADDVESLFAAVEKEWGPVEVLVTNAGAATSAPIARISDEDWQTMLDVNLTGVFRCIRRAVPQMVGAGWGRIVAVASVASRRGDPYIAAYTASKHGVLGLVRAASAELAAKGVTVNAVCPAYVDTAMTDATVETIARLTGRPRDDVRHYIATRQPIGRLITPDEVAEAVWYCVQSPAVTGQGLNVDGGAVQS